MREHDTSTRTFRELLKEITLLMGYEITRDLPLTTRPIQTPLVTIDAPVIAGKKLAIVPILRAGIGMSDGLLELVPSARVGHIGVFRDPDTHEPVEYLVRLPDTSERTFILCDPMVATGNSAVHAVDVLKKRGVPDEHIIFLALVAAPEGVRCSRRASEREAVCRLARLAPERARLHRAGPGRRRRPHLRHQVSRDRASRYGLLCPFDASQRGFSRRLAGHPAPPRAAGAASTRPRRRRSWPPSCSRCCIRWPARR
jgi:uracil phosphoribosyltransferase